MTSNGSSKIIPLPVAPLSSVPAVPIEENPQSQEEQHLQEILPPQPGTKQAKNHPLELSAWQTPRRMVREIFRSDDPVVTTRNLSPQVFYSLVAHMGIQDSVELLEMASKEQLQAVTDFHCWQQDLINEERLLEVLACTDATESLELLGRFIGAIDLKVLACLIGRHTHIVVLDEPEDLPPGEGYYTPDNGSTWIRINESSSTLHFNLARTLAYIFEAKPELFYQLISIPTVHTVSALEEEAYQEKCKRLQSFGFPDYEVACEVNTPLTPAQFEERIKSEHSKYHSRTIKSDSNIAQGSLSYTKLRLFTQLAELVEDFTQFEAEFGFILNSALIRWHVDLSNIDNVKSMAEKVRCAVEIGLEQSLESGCTLLNSYAKFGVRGYYQGGLWHLLQVKNTAQKVKSTISLNELSAPLAQVLEATTENLPSIPTWWHKDIDADIHDITEKVLGTFETEPISFLTKASNIREWLLKFPRLVET
jgi:hypothetical protein